MTILCHKEIQLTIDHSSDRSLGISIAGGIGSMAFKDNDNVR